jgi:hypothetical protein
MFQLIAQQRNFAVFQQLRRRPVAQGGDMFRVSCLAGERDGTPYLLAQARLVFQYPRLEGRDMAWQVVRSLSASAQGLLYFV